MNPRPTRRPIWLSLLFFLCSASYLIWLVALGIILGQIGNIGRAFGGVAHPGHSPVQNLLGLSYLLAPLLYFFSSYLCCNPRIEGLRLRRLFVASLLFLALSVVAFALVTPVDSSTSRARIVFAVVMMSTPFLLASAGVFYTRWGPPARLA